MTQPAEAVAAPGRSGTVPLLAVEDLRKTFPVRRDLLGRVVERVHAVDGVAFTVGVGETLGLVGESGSGKSTTGRLVLRLIPADSGFVLVDGEDLLAMPRRRLREARRDLQMVFQDPFASLDPAWVVADVVAEPLKAFGVPRGERRARAAELLELVGLSARYLERYPYEFSGGQRQRIAIARALALRPRLVVCDEPVSALDVSTQAQVLTLLEDLQRELGLAYLFVAHDLSVVRHVSDRIAVMYLGQLVEVGPAEQVYDEPQHPYTQALLSAVPVADPRRQRTRRRIVLEGDAPSPVHPPAGCRFHTRCPYVMDVCREVPPPLAEVVPGRSVACHLHDHGPTLRGAPVSVLSAGAGGAAEAVGPDPGRRREAAPTPPGQSTSAW